ncbi:YhcN/YlaJ family sporulation lipoprotein [Anaerosalibacter massiliensis]|uniref:YhcN/YlaJ family sporulation lipoprotein n=1 Tax=Anaerosalibacter massiliensis TaxID=1347392 RepID=A0A9X2MGL8_9FIRM|nr:YhcN/YlaJ family sporulation lipoprotein [Anaerosalibacter massiliensis]MCR2042822.1 YhcN/YlaJ family sporulation lipoprotein [Anaerosalibacter massiliensis]
MKNNKIFLFLIFSLALILLGVGCQPQRPNVRNNRMENRVGRDTRDDTNIDGNLNNNLRGDNNLGKDTRRNDTDNIGTNDNRNITDNIGTNDNRNTTDNMNRDLSNRAENISRKVADLNDINSCTTVITGNTALVGIDMENNVEGRVTDDIKRKVEKTVKDADNNITTVSVTADADLYKRLSNMARDIRNGKPVSGFADEIQEILRRITPNM